MRFKGCGGRVIGGGGISRRGGEDGELGGAGKRVNFERRERDVDDLARGLTARRGRVVGVEGSRWCLLGCHCGVCRVMIW